MASPMPLEAPVTIAARSAIRPSARRRQWRGIQSPPPTLARVRRALPVLLTTLVVALAAAGCGGDDSGAAPPPEPAPTAQATDFPAGKGRSLSDLQANAAEGPILAPSVSLVDPGTNRFAF